jgi:oleate hydratase
LGLAGQRNTPYGGEEELKAHIVGGGLASLSAAAYLIRDGGLLANNIFVYEASEHLGGAMGMAGEPPTGYVLPTGRVFERNFRCALDLFSLVPSVSDPEISIKEEILAFNARYGFYDKAHIIDRDQNVIRDSHFGLSIRDRLDLIKLALTPERMLEDRRIDEFFAAHFFHTEFWFLWMALMGSLPQHSAMEMRRFLHRFLHLLPSLSTMTEIYRTRYNQYEAIVKPITKWLQGQGVNFLTGTFVNSIEFKASVDQITANSLECFRNGKPMTVEVEPDDLVLVTNGSQVADLSLGSMDAPAILCSEGRSWALWKRLAHGRLEFGDPEAFFGERHLSDTAWMTFTVTTTNPTFFELITKFTGSEPGRGGHMTFKDSNWLITFTIFPQPHFLEQPPDVKVWWGYALYPYRIGNFIKKPMLECSGAEILQEVLWHLNFAKNTERIIGLSTCIPCILPYAGSVWLPRTRTNRPRAVPIGSTNFGFIGQFAEIPLETIFTMEYSVRSAREAVSTLLKLDAKPPPVYQGQHDPRALYNALNALT